MPPNWKTIVVVALAVVGVWFLVRRKSLTTSSQRGEVRTVTTQPMSDSGTQHLPARISRASRMLPTAGLLRPVPMFEQKVSGMGGVPIA
jgi:hypothetical protein